MKKSRLKNYLKIGILLFGISLTLFTCEKEESITEKNDYFKTVAIDNALEFLNQVRESENRSSEESYITSIANNVGYEDISNSNEQLAVIPVTTVYENLNSRLTLLEINGELKSVVVSLNPFENSTDAIYYGEILITDMYGNFIKAFKIENNLIVSEYFSNSNQNRNLGETYNRDQPGDTGGSCSCLFSVCDLCMLDEVVIYSSSPPPPTPYVSIAHMYPTGGGDTQSNCEVGCDNNWNYGGGGNGNYNPPSSEEDPCDKVNNLESNRAFKDKLEELEENTSLDYETGFLINHNGVPFDPISGNSGQHYIDLDVTGAIDGFIHSHFLPNGNSIFSPDDLFVLYFLFHNGHINDTNTFVMTVVTGHGTSYTIMIDNATAFSNFGLDDLTNPNFSSFSTGYEVEYHMLHNIYGLDEITAREVAMLNALANSGLSLFRGNSDYDEWQQIEAQDNGTVNVDCN